MRKILFLGLIFLTFGCNENKTSLNPSISVSSLKNDTDFNEFVKISSDAFSNYSQIKTSLSKQEILDFENLIGKINFEKPITDLDKSKLISFENQKIITLIENLEQITLLKKILLNKFPKISSEETRGVLYKAIEDTRVLTQKNLRVNGNCRGSYESCLNVSFVASVSCIVMSGSLFTGLCVLGGVAGMEHCRQEYIGCVQDQK